jgi:hypothetical protein
MEYAHTYVTASTTGPYITGTSNCSNVVLYEQIAEKFTYSWDSHEVRVLHPFTIFIKREKIRTHDGQFAKWVHEVKLEDRYITTFFDVDKLSDEIINDKLSDRAKEWLEKQMKSTLKTPTTSSK